MLINENVNHTLKFVADLKGDLEFRVPGQTVIHTHVPTPEELALVESEKKKAEEEKKKKEMEEGKGGSTGKEPATKDKTPAPEVKK